MAGDRVRDEAERLVAAALAAVSSATRGLGASGSGFATGSAECCVCPVCKAIAAMRDPNSDLADRLAAGVGDLATSVTALLRTLSGWGGRAAEPEAPSPSSEGDEFWESLRRKAADAAKAYGRPPSRSTVDDDPWRVATREPEPVPDPPAPRPAPAKAAPTKAAPTKAAPTKTVAKKAVAKKAVATKAAVAPEDSAGDDAPAPAPAARKPMAKKAVKKAVATGGAA